MTKVLHAGPYGRFVEIKSNFGRKRLQKTNKGSNFLGRSFSNGDDVRAAIQFRKERVPAS